MAGIDFPSRVMSSLVLPFSLSNLRYRKFSDEAVQKLVQNYNHIQKINIAHCEVSSTALYNLLQCKFLSSLGKYNLHQPPLIQIHFLLDISYIRADINSHFYHQIPPHLKYLRRLLLDGHKALGIEDICYLSENLRLCSILSATRR